jgi:hypothetical protein
MGLTGWSMVTVVTFDDEAPSSPTAAPPGEARQWFRLSVGAVNQAVSVAQDALGRHPTSRAAWDVVVGLGLAAADGITTASKVGRALTRPVVRVALHPPLLPEGNHPARLLEGVARRGRQERLSGDRDVQRLAAALVPTIVEGVVQQIDLTTLVKKHVDIDALVADVDLDAVAARLDVDAVLDRIDLTTLVRDRVDVDAIVASVDLDSVARRIDVDAIAGRLDIDAVIARLDLVALAQEVIAAIDLPEIIRESTGSMASEAIVDVRMQSIQADEAVSRIVDRLFLRRRRRVTDAPGEPESLRDELLEGDLLEGEPIELPIPSPRDDEESSEATASADVMNQTDGLR